MYNAKLYIKYRYLIAYNPLVSNFKSILYATNYKIYPLVTISFKIVPQSILVALFSSVNDKTLTFAKKFYSYLVYAYFTPH